MARRKREQGGRQYLGDYWEKQRKTYESGEILPELPLGEDEDPRYGTNKRKRLLHRIREPSTLREGREQHDFMERINELKKYNPGTMEYVFSEAGLSPDSKWDDIVAAERQIDRILKNMHPLEVGAAEESWRKRKKAKKRGS